MTEDDDSVYILTDSKQTKSIYVDILGDIIPNIGKYVIDLNEYIKMHSKMFPELANFQGFVGDDL